MADHVLKPPLTEADVRGLRLEDTVRIDGHIFGIRDATQIRIFDEGVPPPPISRVRCAYTLHLEFGSWRTGDMRNCRSARRPAHA